MNKNPIIYHIKITKINQKLRFQLYLTNLKNFLNVLKCYCSCSDSRACSSLCNNGTYKTNGSSCSQQSSSVDVKKQIKYKHMPQDQFNFEMLIFKSKLNYQKSLFSIYS